MRPLLLMPIFGILLLTSICVADPIPGLFNTGVDNANALLAGGSVDPHYKLIQSQDPSTTNQQAFVSTSIPGSFTVNGPTSKWIGPTADLNGVNPFGEYIYRLQFDLTGLNPSTASITGQLGSDNSIAIDLNGNPVFSDGGGFAFFIPFSINSGFVGGVNNLDFKVTQLGAVSPPNPTALRVEFATAAAATPEPGGLIVVIGVGLMFRHKRRLVAVGRA